MRHSLALGLSTTLLAATGCSALGDESADGVQVAAAFYPLEYVAARVAGEHAEVVALTTPGQEPHDLELTISETADLARADLVIYEADFQAAVDAAVEQNATGEVLDAAAVVGLLPVADEDHADEELHTADDGHDHEGGLDPHFWLDPRRMATLGDAVAEALEEIDPDHADDYTSNAAALRTDLEALDAGFEAGLADCERTTVVVSHDAFGYLTRYGLEFAPVAGLSPDAEPSPAGLRDLQLLIADEGVTTVFSERLASPKLTQSLADDVGVTTAILDPIEGLSDETADEDYLSLMEQNLTSLQEANACR
ncbi:metal ABC transporter substrate-binding protein [Nocardioides sp.]|uniref:metal ABC transporter substrate-binding protein n=1 Tax=Nocardioides sp. TaxID=35761 RepID=UPI002B26A9E3|nr:metal ABC transporter substrate-binding protein [Nocardioides sp.]